MAQKRIVNLAREKMLQDRGVLLKEEGVVVREYKAMHEENFLSSWLREDRKDGEEKSKGNGQEDRRRDEQKADEGRGERRKRNGEVLKEGVWVRVCGSL